MTSEKALNKSRKTNKAGHTSFGLQRAYFFFTFKSFAVMFGCAGKISFRKFIDITVIQFYL